MPFRIIGIFIVFVAGVPSLALSEPFDPHSFARPEWATVEHLELDVSVDFDQRRISGRASLHLRDVTGPLVLDTSALEIHAVTLDDGRDAPFELGDPVEHLGRSLTVNVDATTKVVHVDYASAPEAYALLWLGPEQTAGKQAPFVFSQSQSVYARTWIPCPDSPGLRFTYEATVRVQPGLMALMSAENPREIAEDGVYRFSMPERVPAYLLALAVGRLEFFPMGPRTGIYAEPELVEAAAWEFAETESMMEVVESLYGPYQWSRYDILVLPPYFPLGGMENPRLTFATPTILAGDRSLVSLVAHELAHSWSGNLVTNQTWSDLWLNEGFTVYIERRVMEEIHDRDYAEMLATLGLQDLQQDVEKFGADSVDTHLRLQLAGRNPEDSFSNVAYEKGYFFLRLIEETAGREAFDDFLRDYFERHSFATMNSDVFLQELRSGLFADGSGWESLRVDDWVDGPGIPDNCPSPSSRGFELVDGQLERWKTGTPAEKLHVEGWTTHHWLHFLRHLPSDVDRDRLGELDATFALSDVRNAEILSEWIQRGIESWYEPVFDSMTRFLLDMGRGKFLRPIYTRLAQTQNGLALAREIYVEARPRYHPLAARRIDEILHWQE